MARGGSDLDRALDELYGAAPAAFTTTRDALAKRLKAGGDAAAASAIKTQRRPTQIAYVLNQLARREADDVADLVDVGRELARAQRKALRGEAGHDLREAIARQRRVVAALTGKAADLMRDLGMSAAAEGHLDEIAGALQAALVDPVVGAKLEEGRLEKVPEAATGFPGATTAEAMSAAPPPPPARTRADAKADAKAGVRARTDAAARAKERAKEEAREKVEGARREKARAGAAAAEAEAAKRNAVAEAAEREADGYAAQSKKLGDEARALAAEAKRLAGEAKRAAHEAEAAQRSAERAETDAKRALVVAKRARTAARARS